MEFRCEKFHKGLIEPLAEYMRRTPVANNSSPKNIKLQRFNDTDGALFLLMDATDTVRGTSGVVCYENQGVKFAKIYFRFHIEPGVPHSLIDRFIEPATFDWCEERGIKNFFLTVNEGQERTLGWVSSRLGSRRGCFNVSNPYDDRFSEIRNNFRPYSKKIFDSYTWQFAIYSSPDQRFDIGLPEKPLTDEEKKIFEKEFSHLKIVFA